MDFEHQFGIKLSVLIAGLVGGTASLTYYDNIPARRAILMIFSGAATAAYLQPMAELYLSLNERVSVGFGFILGLASMKIIDFVIKNTERFLRIKFLLQNEVPQNGTSQPASNGGSNVRNGSSPTAHPADEETKE